MRRGSYFVLCFVTAVVCLWRAQLGVVGKKERVLGIPRQRSLPDCPVDPRITTFLKGLRSFKRLGQKGKAGHRMQRSTTEKWPYNCRHVGYNHQAEVMEVFTFECCEICDKHHYRCMGDYKNAGICSSEAIRCIVQCIRKNDETPGTACISHGNPGMGSPPGPGGQKCRPMEKKVGGSYCLQKACISV